MIIEFQSEENKAFVKRQTEAIARALLLKKGSAPMTFDEVTGLLADAEIKAGLMSGLVALDVDVQYKMELKKHMLQQQFIAVDAEGHVSLTPAGLSLAKTPLPLEIQAHLVFGDS